MNYLRILKKSVRTIWKNKFLFIFGFFVSLFAVCNSFIFNFENKAEFDVFIEKIKNFIAVYPDRAVIFLSIVAVIFIALLFFKVVGDVGLIKCANNIDAGRDGADFQFGFKTGIKKFWAMLIMKILLGLVIFAVLILLAVPCLFMFANHLYVPGVILSLFALVIFVPLVVVVSFSLIYGERYLVVDGEGVLKSIKKGANLFLENVKSSLVVALLLFLVSISVLVIIFFGLFLVFLPFLAVGFTFSVLVTGLGALLVMMVILPLLLVMALIVSVVLTTFQSVVWTLTFRQIR